MSDGRPLEPQDYQAITRVLAYAHDRMDMWGPVYAERLAADMRRMIDTRSWPSDGQLADAPRLDDWRVVGDGTDHRLLVGDVRGHPRLGTRRGIATSRIMLLGVGCARTESRWYRLGVAAESQYRRTLRERHPRLFQENAALEVGYGWRSIVSQLLAELDALSEPPQIVHVREKMGGLQVSYIGDAAASAAARPIRERAEAAALCTCHECGRPGVLRNAGGGYAVRCDAHATPGSSIETVQ